jgi:hypothetical protein
MVMVTGNWVMVYAYEERSDAAAAVWEGEATSCCHIHLDEVSTNTCQQ